MASSRIREEIWMTDIDIELLNRCLGKLPRAWEDFVDRFMGLVLHVVDEMTLKGGLRIERERRELICERVFISFYENDFSQLRAFGGESRLASYLSVIARRTAISEILADTELRR